MENKLTRVNVRISSKLKDYFEKRSKETGVSQSSLMALALEEYVSQKEIIEFTRNMDGYMEKLERIKGEIN